MKNFHQKIALDILEYGRSVVCVGDDDAPFCYTIGNHLHGLPEFLVIGTIRGDLLNVLSDLKKAFANGELVNLGGRLSVMVVDAREEAKTEYTIQAGQHLGHQDYALQQVLIPDKEGRFPGDPLCIEPFSLFPVLARTKH